MAPRFKISSSFGANFFLVLLPTAHLHSKNLPIVTCIGGHCTAAFGKERTVMKIFISALLALSVLAGLAAPVSAFDPWKDDAGLRSPL